MVITDAIAKINEVPSVFPVLWEYWLMSCELLRNAKTLLVSYILSALLLHKPLEK